jgi:transcriptional regulator with XRE-family HTH domain
VHLNNLKRAKHKAYLSAFCRNIKKERESRDLTQDQLAEESGIDIRTIQRIEACEQNPSLDVVISLIIGLGLEPEKTFDFLKDKVE